MTELTLTRPRALFADAWLDVAHSGWVDYRAIYTVRSWLLGWAVRLIAQVTYFGLLGVLANDQAAVESIVLGNVVLLTSVSTLFSVSAVARESWSGTIDGLLLARLPLAATLTLRNIVWVGDGCATALLALICTGAMFGTHYPVQTYLVAVPVCLVAGLATLGAALVAGTMALDRPTVRTLLSGVLTAALAALCGVNFPLPDIASAIARILPISSPVAALNHAAQGQPWIGDLGVGVLVAAGWLALAAVVMSRWAARRRVGAGG